MKRRSLKFVVSEYADFVFSVLNINIVSFNHNAKLFLVLTWNARFQMWELASVAIDRADMDLEVLTDNSARLLLCALETDLWFSLLCLVWDKLFMMLSRKSLLAVMYAKKFTVVLLKRAILTELLWNIIIFNILKILFWPSNIIINLF